MIPGGRNAGTSWEMYVGVVVQMYFKLMSQHAVLDFDLGAEANLIFKKILRVSLTSLW